MPNFLYTVIALSILTWGALLKYMSIIPPETNLSKILFCLLFFVAMSLTLSVVHYIFGFKKAPKMSDLKKIYRNNIKRSLGVSVVITILVFLKIFDLLSPVTFLVFVVFVIMIYRNYSKRRRFYS